MFDSMTRRALSKSVPVSLMYKRMAWTLSPADFERQSRATPQMSTVFPVSPKAPLDMTQVSRASLGQTHDMVARISFRKNFASCILVLSPRDNNMCVSFNLKQWHDRSSLRQWNTGSNGKIAGRDRRLFYPTRLKSRYNPSRAKKDMKKISLNSAMENRFEQSDPMAIAPKPSGWENG